MVSSCIYPRPKRSENKRVCPFETLTTSLDVHDLLGCASCGLRAPPRCASPCHGPRADLQRPVLAGDSAFDSVLTPHSGLGPLWTTRSLARCSSTVRPFLHSLSLTSDVVKVSSSQGWSKPTRTRYDIFMVCILAVFHCWQKTQYLGEQLTVLCRGHNRGLCYAA